MSSDRTIRLGDFLFVVPDDVPVVEELWYQYTDILYPMLATCPLPILFHEGPYAFQPAGGPPAGVALDVGANIGMFAIGVSAAFASVVAFEPDATARKLLEQNLTLNRISNVTVLPTAVGEQSGQAPLLSSTSGLGTARIRLDEPLGATGETAVDVTSIDEVVARLGLDSVGFIKADIEGAEPLALMGASQTIERFLPTLSICTYHDPSHPTEIRHLLEQFGGGRYRFVQTPFKLHAFRVEGE